MEGHGGQAAQPIDEQREAGRVESYRELTIVPDGVLWYVPFEALQVVEDGVSTPLIGKLRIRYAQTISLVPPDPRGVNRRTDTTVVAGRLFPRDDTLTEDALAEMRKVSDRIATLPSPLPAPSNLLGACCNRLVVLADFDQPAAVRTIGRRCRSTRQAARFACELVVVAGEGPQQLVLPGFHTPAEVALRKAAPARKCSFRSAG